MIRQQMLSAVGIEIFTIFITLKIDTIRHYRYLTSDVIYRTNYIQDGPLIAPLVSGVAGLSASSSSKVDTSNI